MRLVPASECIIGSTPEEIEATRHLDIYGHEFTLLDELPQFHAFVPDFYVSEHTVTNDQFAKLLNKMAGQFSGDPWYIRRLSKIAELEKRAVE